MKQKFKVGDKIRPIDSVLGSSRYIKEVCDGWYVTDRGILDFEYESNWELDDLEEVSRQYALANPIEHIIEDIDESYDLQKPKLDFISGAQHQREKDVSLMKLNYEMGKEDGRKELMKDAIEGYIVNAGGEEGYNVAVFRFDENHTFNVLLPVDPKAKYGDIVKLIIVK